MRRVINMKYIYSIIILLLGLYNYQYGMNSIIYLISNLIFLILIFFSNKNKSITFRLIELLIVSWPISWINIFGTNTSELQLPWYYIIGLLLVLFIIIQKKISYKIKGKKLIIMNYIFLLLYSVIPLIICNNFTNGLGDYIMLMFFLIIMFVSHFSSSYITKEETEELRKMFIFINFICAIGIIFQYVMFKNYGQTFFKLGRSGSFSGYQISCSLLFEDTSCSTIMLGCGFIYAVMSTKNKKINYIFAIVILIGLALTSRRTSVISLVIILIPILLNTGKGIIKKLGLIIISPLIILTALYFLNLSRPVDNVSQYTQNNGRFIDYISGIDVAIHNPIGIGYGDTYLASKMNSGIIPHNTILRWIDQGGVFLAIPLILIFIDILLIAKNKKMTLEFWNLIYVFLASNFIPDIFNSRFLIIIFTIVLLYEKGEIKYESKTHNIHTNIQ